MELSSVSCKACRFPTALPPGPRVHGVAQGPAVCSQGQGFHPEDETGAGTQVLPAAGPIASKVLLRRQHICFYLTLPTFSQQAAGSNNSLSHQRQEDSKAPERSSAVTIRMTLSSGKVPRQAQSPALGVAGCRVND